MLMLMVKINQNNLISQLSYFLKNLELLERSDDNRITLFRISPSCLSTVTFCALAY